MNIRYLTILFLVFAQVLSACGGGAAPTDPEGVVRAFDEALSERDIDTAMSYVAEDATFINPLGKFSGSDAVRAHLEEVYAGETLTFEITELRVEGAKVYTSYRLLQGGGEIASGNDGLTVVLNGKIVFDASPTWWTLECNRDSTQVFCVE
jgi:ketosteroid isomerase-like protein